MMGHPSVPGLTGGTPASLSRAAYYLLRTWYHFAGVAITDSLGAGAIRAAGYSEAAAAVQALEAGADMALIDAADRPSVESAIVSAVQSGALTTAAVDPRSAASSG